LRSNASLDRRCDYTKQADRIILGFMRTRSTVFAVLFTFFVLSSNALAQSALSAQNWVGSWAASQQIPEPHNALPPDDLHDATLRQIVHLSVGGPAVRVHLSNAFGTAPLHLTLVHIARPLSTSVAQIDPASDKALTFSGSPDVIIPAGAEYLSDPVEYPVKPLSDLAVSIHYDEPPAQQTGHPGSRATSYVAHGNLVSAADLPEAKKIEHWYQLAGVDVVAPSKAAAIVVLGDSITDGHGATTNGNDRWTDILALTPGTRGRRGSSLLTSSWQGAVEDEAAFFEHEEGGAGVGFAFGQGTMRPCSGSKRWLQRRKASWMRWVTSSEGVW
jgi:hypothetical protein